MTEKSWTYSVVRVQQLPKSEPFYMASIRATELLLWADVPRKRAQFKAGYQRPLDETRTAAIKQFIEQDPGNIMPSAIIIALADDHVTISEGDPCGQLTVTFDDAISVATRVAELLARFRARLSADELASIGLPLDDLETATDEVQAEAETEPDSPVPPASYIAALTAELGKYESLPDERRELVHDYVDSISKPGLILDGQHRVFGAKDVVGDVFLPVVLLPHLTVEEQVFQFYILNNKARPLDQTQLRSIISTSLSDGEIVTLFDRFSAAKLDADESRWTYQANTDLASPFRGLVSFGLSGEDAPIKENVANQLITRFVKMSSKYSALYSSVPAWNNQDYRIGLFYTLWRTVASRYPIAWEMGKQGKGQMFRKVALIVLQEFVLSTLKAIVPFQPESSLASLEQFETDVRTSLNTLPEEFFTKDWQEKSLDTAAGQEFLLDQMMKVVQNNGKNMNYLKLFRVSQ